jgi:hypothetical protein
MQPLQSAHGPGVLPEVLLLTGSSLLLAQHLLLQVRMLRCWVQRRAQEYQHKQSWQCPVCLAAVVPFVLGLGFLHPMLQDWRHAAVATRHHPKP